MARKIYTESFQKKYKRYVKLYKKQERSFERANIRDFVKQMKKEGRVFENKRKAKEAYKEALREGEYIRKYLMKEDVFKKSQFFTYYPAMKDYLEKKGLNRDVSSTIVSKQAFNRSRTQYLALKRRKEELLYDTGLDVSKITEMEFRKGYFEEELSAAIKNDYYYMKDVLGITDTYELRDRITEIYFGDSK